MVKSTESASVTDVAIVGGGMMGATLALMFAQAFAHTPASPAFKITLIEAKALTPSNNQLSSFDERSTAISPTTKEALERLGLWSDVLPFTSEINRIHVSDQGQMGVANLGPEDNQQEPLGYVVSNAGLGQVLLRAMSERGVQLLAPCEVTGVIPKKKGVNVVLSAKDASCEDESLAQEASLFARLLIVADGADSPIRKKLGIGERVHDYQQHAMVANVQFALPHNGCAYERFTPNGPMALLPIGGANSCKSALVWTWPSAQVEALKALTEQELLQRLQQQFGFRLGAFCKMGARSYYPLELRTANEQVRSNIVLMGNAAHFLHPVAGQGFNLAVRDGLRLVDVLQKAGAESLGLLSVLQEYENAQRADQARTVFLSHGFNQVFGVSSYGVPHLRSLGFLLMNTLSPVKQQLILQLSGKASPKAQPLWRHG